MFPSDSITIYKEIFGITQQTLVAGNSPKTILAITMQQSKDLSDTVILCGSQIIAKNYAKDLPMTLMNYKCSDDLIISKTGNDESSTIITYIPYYQNDFYFGSTSNQGVYNPTANIATSTDVKIYGSITAGEVVISFLLLCIIVLALIKAVTSALSNIKTKKTYLSYGGGDVEVREDL